MKAELKIITEEMSTENLAKTLNENFEFLNQLQHEREMAIFNRLREIESKMNNQFDDVNKRMNNQFDDVNDKLKAIMNHLSGKKLLTED